MPIIPDLGMCLCTLHPGNGVLELHNPENIILQKSILTGSMDPLSLPISQS